MPEFMESDLTFDVDFNNAVDRGRLIKTSLRRHAGRTPEVGERCYLRDGEGNTCWGYVDSINGPMILFAIDDSSWASGTETIRASGAPQGRS